MPTEFELITAIAFEYFARHRCDIVVLEVGMGGRLDSTNIISPASVAVSVITGIAMDHVAFLGDTPEKIAAEKAGIIKTGIPVVFGGAHIGGDTNGNAFAKVPAIIASVAMQRGARYIRTDFNLLSVEHSDLSGSTFSFGAMHDLFVPLPGLYQPYNAATALTVLKVLQQEGYSLSASVIREGLATVRWPGRFEILCRDPLVISDGGHNPEGIDATVASVKAYMKGKKIYLLSGVMADKNYTYMVHRMCTIASRVFTVRPNNVRALSADDYARAFVAEGIPAEGYATVVDAVSAAMTACRETNTPLLCLGSLYMYSEVRKAVLAEA